MVIVIFVPEVFIDSGIYHRDQNEERRLMVVTEHDEVVRGARATVTLTNRAVMAQFPRI